MFTMRQQENKNKPLLVQLRIFFSEGFLWFETILSEHTINKNKNNFLYVNNNTMFIKQQAWINSCSVFLSAKIRGKQESFKSFAKIVNIFLNRTKYFDFRLGELSSNQVSGSKHKEIWNSFKWT